MGGVKKARSARLAADRAPSLQKKPPVRDIQGFILVCDVVGFSEKSTDEQVECVRFLSKSFEKTLKKLRQVKSCEYMNCTGDGFLAVLKQEDVSVRSSILTACLKIIEDCDGARKLQLKVRFGIHQGSARTDVEVFGSRHMFGDGPNYASRVAAIGDGSHVIVSEEFFKGAGNNKAWQDQFSDPWDVSIKHNRTARIRAYLKTNNDGKPKKARRLQLIEVANQRLAAALMSLRASIQAALLNRAATNGESALGLRLTVFVPQGEELRPAFRVGSLGARVAGQTSYRISPPKGAIGHAFAHRKALYLLDLPDPDAEASAKDYLDRWLSAGWDLTEGDVKQWGRHPRSMFAIPFATDLPREELHAVLCVDLSHPLTGVEPEFLVGLITEGLKAGTSSALLSRMLA